MSIQNYILLNFMQCMNLNEVSISKVFHIQIWNRFVFSINSLFMQCMNLNEVSISKVFHIQIWDRLDYL